MASKWQWGDHKTHSADYDIVVDYDTGVKPVEQEPSEFARFEDLAGKLIAVPKTELDEKRGN